MTDLKTKLHDIIFEADTPAGKAFDIILIICILLSVAVVMLDSVQSIRERHHELLYVLEWFFTILFTIEYALRLILVNRPLRYARSFYGIVDLLSILPTYISLLIPGTEYLLAIRTLRTVRIWRILKLAHYLSEMNVITYAMRASARKITVFLTIVISLVTVLGSIMYLVESPEAGFTSIPRSIYWAVVTLTTVGYGDISPQTNIGQFLAALAMIMGYAIIAVPTGIVTVELANIKNQHISTRVCHECTHEGHDPDAKFCKFCGAGL